MPRLVAVSASLLLFASLACAHPPYRLQDLGDFAGGSASAGALGINGLGEAVGGADNELGRQAFVLRNGKLVQLPTPGPPRAEQSEAFAINLAGTIAGNIYDPLLRSRAVLWDDAGYRELGTLGGPESSVLDINASGAVVGIADTPTDRATFLWLDAPAYGFPAGMSRLQGFFARAINDHGHIASQVRDNAGEFHAAIWLPKADLGLPAGLSPLLTPLFPSGVLPQGMNNRGVIAGGGRPDEISERPTLWLPTPMYDLPAGWHDLGVETRDRGSFAWDVNDRGWTVGTRTWAGDPPSEFEDPPIFQQGWIWIPGRGRVDLDTLLPAGSGYFILYPRAINNRGQIVASAASVHHLGFRAVLLTPMCPADWNADAVSNSGDFFDFLTDFFAGHADFNADGPTTSQDFFDFLVAFFSPC